MKNTLKILALSFLVISCGFAVAYATYEITSNEVTVEVAQGANLALSASSTSINVGQSLTLTATLSDYANGVVVSFYDGGNTVGQATTSGGGIATLTVNPNAGTHIYKAIATHP